MNTADEDTTQWGVDALLDRLGSTNPPPAEGDPVAGLLLSWRKEADSEPIAELVDTDLAMAVIASSRSTPARRSHRFLVPVATAAAVLAIAFTGVGVAAKKKLGSVNGDDGKAGLTDKQQKLTTRQREMSRARKNEDTTARHTELHH
jgi:hypothetical protein